MSASGSSTSKKRSDATAERFWAEISKPRQGRPKGAKTVEEFAKETGYAKPSAGRILNGLVAQGKLTRVFGFETVNGQLRRIGFYVPV
mgnify:CR=1 FL=1